MIQLKPDIYHSFTCPRCKKNDVVVNDYFFTGIHTLADCSCRDCKLDFYHDFPIGLSLLYPEAISKDGSQHFASAHSWYAKNFLKIFNNKYEGKIDLQISKLANVQMKEVVILNCLDTIYGHSLLRLLNAQYYIDHCKNLGLIVLITKNLEWLVPDGVAEKWIVDLPMSQMDKWFVRLDEFVKKELQRFDKVYLDLAFATPDPSTIDIEKFTKVKRFDVKKFDKQPFTLTFILREDRYWQPTETEVFIWKVGFKLKLLKYFKYFFSHRQNFLMKRTMRKIKKAMPTAVINVVGLGTIGKFPAYINDYRAKMITAETEQAWCELYGKSHLVIGVHGSNMLLPTAMAGGFVEILPFDRLGNILQDTLLPYSKREQAFFGRYIYRNTSPKHLAQTIMSIWGYYYSFRTNMTDEYLKHDIYTDVSTKWPRNFKDFSREDGEIFNTNK